MDYGSGRISAFGLGEDGELYFTDVESGQSHAAHHRGHSLRGACPVLMKPLRLAGQLIETRLLMRHPDGEPAGKSRRYRRV
ncbi:MAG: hypothetical protein EXR82_02795 [Gammaproteobacteria bacterium]|nr:hypothetical protein [Gammaproteobacteria bacterium]